MFKVFFISILFFAMSVQATPDWSPVISVIRTTDSEQNVYDAVGSVLSQCGAKLFRARVQNKIFFKEYTISYTGTPEAKNCFWNWALQYR